MVLSGKEDKNRASIDAISYVTVGQVAHHLYFVKIGYEGNRKCPAYSNVPAVLN